MTGSASMGSASTGSVPASRAAAALRIGEYAATAPAATPAVVDTVARAVLDTVSVAVAARNDPLIPILTTHALPPPPIKGKDFGDETPGRDSKILPANRGLAGVAGGASRLWTGGGWASAEQAALVNGAAAHVLDYDDVTSPMRGHPSVALLPGLLALAEAEDLDGGAVATAYAVGFEVIVKLSRALVPGHYAAGWHSTTTVGGIGATVAAARLLGLNATATADAIGLFLGQCAGTRENFGTQAKSFQVGAACAASVRSALLARAGLTAGHGCLDGPAGFATLYGGAPFTGDGPTGGEGRVDSVERLHAELDALGAGDGELRAAGLDVKKYPLCYATHRALDAVLDLRTEADLGPGDVTAVEVRTSGAALTPVVHDRPGTGLEAKFSMEYAMATALLDGHVRLGAFTDEAVLRPAAQELLTRVRARETDTPMTPRWAEVSLHLTDGRVLRRRAETLRGSAGAPLSLTELTEKAADCFAHGGVPRAAKPFADALRGWAGRPVREVLAALPADSPTGDSPAADSPAADSAADSPTADSPTADGTAADSEENR